MCFTTKTVSPNEVRASSSLTKGRTFTAIRRDTLWTDGPSPVADAYFGGSVKTSSRVLSSKGGRRSGMTLNPGPYSFSAL